MRRKGAVYPFVVVLKNSEKKTIQGMGLLLGGLAIGLSAYRSLQETGAGMSLLFLVAVVILYGWNIAQLRKNRAVRYRLLFGLSGAGMILVAPFSWLGVLYLLLAALEPFAARQQEIGFHDDHIRFSDGFQKTYAWQELRNVILKDGILTIDFRNNRLFQKETDDADEDDYDGDEEAFNRYCRERLADADKHQ